jgi:hypothetical protein
MIRRAASLAFQPAQRRLASSASVRSQPGCDFAGDVLWIGDGFDAFEGAGACMCARHLDHDGAVVPDGLTGTVMARPLR